MRIDLRVKHGVETRRLVADLFADVLGCAGGRKKAVRSESGREKMAADIPRVRKRGAADHGRQAGQVDLQLIQARAAKGRESSRQRAARSYLATTRRMARPPGSQITARNPAVAMPWTMSSGAPAA